MKFYFIKYSMGCLCFLLFFFFFFDDKDQIAGTVFTLNLIDMLEKTVDPYPTTWFNQTAPKIVV